MSEAPNKEGFDIIIANIVELNKIRFDNMVDKLQFNEDLAKG